MSLVNRASNIVARPNAEWPAIAMEPATPASLFVGYVVPLAAIAPIASFVGFSIVGVGLPFVGTYRIGFVAGITNALVSYVFALIGVLLLATIVNVLAPSFGARKSWPDALKLTAYALTPSFLAGILLIFPPLGILGLIAGLYAIVLMFLGIPVVMGASKEKTPVYVLSIVGCTIVLGVIFGVVGAAVRVGTYAATGAFDSNASATDTAHAQDVAAAVVGGALGGSAANREAARQAVGAVANAAAQAKAADASGDANAQTAAGVGMLKALVTGGKSGAAIPRTELQALLPERFGGMQRADARSESGSFAGIKGSKAVVRFSNADRAVQIEVSDLGNARGLTAIAGVAAKLTESEDDAGYEKNVDVGGQNVHESWKNANEHGELLSMVDDRFAVAVTSDGVPIDTALDALKSVDVDKLHRLATESK